MDSNERTRSSGAPTSARVAERGGEHLAAALAFVANGPSDDPQSAARSLAGRAAEALGAAGALIAWRDGPAEWPPVVQVGLSQRRLDALTFDFTDHSASPPTLAAEIEVSGTSYGRVVVIDPAGPFDPSAQELLSSFAHLIGFVLVRHALAESERARTDTVEHLLGLLDLAAGPPVENVRELLAETARVMLGAAASLVVLVAEARRPATAEVSALAASAPFSDRVERQHLDAVASRLVGSQVADGAPVRLPALSELDERTVALLGSLEVSKVALVRLALQEACEGWLVVLWADRTEPDATDLRLRLRALGSFGAVMIEGSHALERALHDDLTGLANRHLFVDRVEQSLAAARRRQRRLAVIYLDLDDFKHVNDMLGHVAGDELLVLVASRLCEVLREEDTLARLGGDEFAVLLPEIESAEAAVAAAEKVRANLAEPFEVAGRRLRVTPSVGVVTYPDDGSTREDLIRHADLAMYRAKAKGRDGVVRFAREMARAAEDAFGFEDELRQAIGGGQLAVLYQPQLTLADGRICGLEALVRWEHPTRGTLPAAAFMEIAESSGLVLAVDTWVLGQACRDVQRWRAEGLAVPLLAVNIAAVDLTDAVFCSVLDEILLHTGVKHAALELEISGDLAREDSSRAVRLIGSLRALGLRIAIDDFGSSRSLLGQLRTARFDTVKVNCAELTDLDPVGGGPGAKLLDGVVAFARALGIRVVAEGVETQAQRACLEAAGCDAVQGWLYAEPVRADVVSLLLARHPVRAAT